MDSVEASMILATEILWAVSLPESFVINGDVGLMVVACLAMLSRSPASPEL
jgi:hypothetical protein